MDAVIYNAADLKLEIARLKQAKNKQEIAIKQHFNSPLAIWGTIISLFHKSKKGNLNDIGLPGHDFMAWLAQFLPITLDKTIFRRWGFVMRALIRLLTRKASHLVNDKSVGGLWIKIKGAIPKGIMDKITPKKDKPASTILSSKRIENKRLKS